MDTTANIPKARLLGLEAAARYLGVTPRSVQNLIRRGAIRPVKLPGLRRTLLELRDLEKLVDQGRVDHALRARGSKGHPGEGAP